MIFRYKCSEEEESFLLLKYGNPCNGVNIIGVDRFPENAVKGSVYNVVVFMSFEGEWEDLPLCSFINKKEVLIEHNNQMYCLHDMLPSLKPLKQFKKVENKQSYILPLTVFLRI